MPTVVYADDSPTMRRIVSAVLTKDGFDVVTAEDGLAAVQAVFRTQPDAVVLDVQMPRLSGYVAARLLTEDWQTADIPVILLTSLDAASDRYWGGQTGATRYLTKDFQPPELVGALTEVIDAAAARRDGRPPLRPEPLELSDEDVMSRVCDLLDRKLFETSVAAEVTGLAAAARGLEQTVAGVLGVLATFVDFELAAVLLVEERGVYLTVESGVSRRHYNQFLTSVTEAATAATGADCVSIPFDVQIADRDGRLGDAEDDLGMATFLSMPLRGHGGQVVGVLALSSSSKNAFGESALTTLRLVEGPVAIVVDNARLSGSRTG